MTTGRPIGAFPRSPSAQMTRRPKAGGAAASRSAEGARIRSIVDSAEAAAHPKAALAALQTGLSLEQFRDQVSAVSRGVLGRAATPAGSPSPDFGALLVADARIKAGATASPAAQSQTPGAALIADAKAKAAATRR